MAGHLPALDRVALVREELAHHVDQAAAAGDEDALLAQHAIGVLSRYRCTEIVEHKLPGPIPGRGTLALRFGRFQPEAKG